MLGIVIFMLAVLAAAVAGIRQAGRATADARSPPVPAASADPVPAAPIPSGIAPADATVTVPSVRPSTAAQDPLMAMMCGPGLCTPVDG